MTELKKEVYVPTLDDFPMYEKLCWKLAGILSKKFYGYQAADFMSYLYQLWCACVEQFKGDRNVQFTTYFWSSAHRMIRDKFLRKESEYWDQYYAQRMRKPEDIKYPISLDDKFRRDETTNNEGWLGRLDPNPDLISFSDVKDKWETDAVYVLGGEEKFWELIKSWLTERQYQILRYRFVDKLTQREVASKLDIWYQDVAKQEKTILQRIRDKFADHKKFRLLFLGDTEKQIERTLAETPMKKTPLFNRNKSLHKIRQIDTTNQCDIR